MNQEQLERNKRFADHCRKGLVKNGKYEFEGKVYEAYSIYGTSEYFLMDFAFDPSGFMTKNECVAFCNFDDTHG